LETIHTESESKGLAKNTIYNLIGQVLPMIIGVITIPILIKSLGVDRFGIITICWMLIGYFSLFDMGLGRALTQLIADKLGKHENDKIPSILGTALFLMSVFSIGGSLIISALATLIAHRLLKIPAPLMLETINSIHIMSITIPFVVVTSAFIGYLTAYKRFDIINIIRIPTGAFLFIAPILVLPYSSRLEFSVVALAVGRIITTYIYYKYCVKITPGLRSKISVDRKMLKPLFHFGGWMTLSNIISPIMVYFDRLIIGSMVSLSAVAFYTTPFEIIKRIFILPNAMMGVLFPTFATSYAKDIHETAKIHDAAITYLMLLLFPIMFFISLFSAFGLSVWISEEFSSNSFRVLQILCVGVYLNSIAQVPFSFLQGIGKPHITSKLHVVEIILYIPLLWLLISKYGIIGAALAFSLRVILDTALLFYISSRYLPHKTDRHSSNITSVVISTCLLTIITVCDTAASKAILLLLFPALLIISWKRLLDKNEREYLINKLRSVFA